MSEQKIAAITGGAGALGSALAEVLVERGYRVALFDIDKSRARAEEIAARLGKERVVVHAGDFGAAETWTAALDATKRAFGAFPQYAALVAGGWDGGGPLHAAKDDSAYDKMMKLNVDTAYRAFRALLPS